MHMANELPMTVGSTSSIGLERVRLLVKISSSMYGREDRV